MQFSYVLPAPASHDKWTEFDGDLACVKRAGYDAVELQIADPALFDEARARRSLDAAGLTMCAFQTGTTYGSRGNCLCTADESVRRRTVELLKSFVDLAARWKSLIVFGLLQGRLSDEPDRSAGSARIREAIREVGEYASEQDATLAFEPVQQGEVGFHNTIAQVAELVRDLNLPGLRMMIDTFHMNIEERDMFAPLPAIRDLLAHVHLCETNRGVLGEGHWPTTALLVELKRLGYAGYCSMGVYNTTRNRRECITRCMTVLQRCRAEAGLSAPSRGSEFGKELS
jgi:sugar phosphate isomerase/epimerase